MNRTNTASSRSLVRELNTFPQLYGPEGQELTQKLNEVTQTIQKDEPIQRLLKSLKEVNERRHQDLQLYLDRLRAEARAATVPETNSEIACDQSEFTELVIDIAWQVWEKLRSYFLSNDLCLEVPDACPGQRNNFMYTWSKGEHYFECEIFGSKEVEFFYRNRNSNEVWGEDTTLGQEFSTTILDKARLFAW